MNKAYTTKQRRRAMQSRMAKFFASIVFLVSALWGAAQAPAPVLPAKGSLPQTLLSNRTFSGTAADTVTRTFNGNGPYTLEVVARVTAATGRGLDIEARNGALNGFRLSLDGANLKSSGTLTAPSALSASRLGEEHTIRIAVRNDSAYFYQNGAYLQGQPLGNIKNIVNGVETDGLLNQSGTNIVSGWAGTTGNYGGAPSAYGWSATNPAVFAAANATTTGTARYMDVHAGNTGNIHTYNGTTYTGRTFYMRWDGSNTNVVYSYPVTLEANTTYDFSMLSAYISNGPSGLARNLTVGIGTSSALADRFASKVFANTTMDLKRAGFSFTSTAAGTYYLTFNGNEGLYSIAELSINKLMPGSLMPNWGGMAPNLTGTYSTPASYGWTYHGGTGANATGWLSSAANSGSGVRLMDITPSSTGNVHTYNGSSYTGRLFYIRWDGTAVQNVVYRYPVVLEANTTYNFSMLHAYINNLQSGGTRKITVGVGKDTTVAGRISSRDFYPSGTRYLLNKEDFAFTSQDAGLYYLTITGEWAIYSIGELTLNKIAVQPRFVFGKNYPAGAADMQIVSATYDPTGAYAPAAPVANTRQPVTLTGASVKVMTTFNTAFVVPGKTDVHFTGEYTPYGNSSIDLQTNDSWLFFDNVRPSKVISDWLPTVTINGAAAVNNANVRIAIYKNGTAVIPNGNLTSTAALTVYDQPAQAGASQTYATQTIFNNLGNFNNAIRSFTLKRGYMVTFANNPNGSGYSRVFIANDSDLVVNTMPNGLNATASFIRVMPWDWPSKKGKAGWNPGKVNATWYYDWNISGGNTADFEYQGIRQTQYWPDYNAIANRGVNHISGFNEPDRPDQSNLTVEEAFNSWSGMYIPGLRVGSPSPADPEGRWITDFLRKTDSANYRVDYVTIHCYWGGQTPAQWASRLKAIYNRVKRPLWITEWNNGANWTTASETWPADVPSQLQKQLNDMKGILYVLDTCSFVERYAEYDWVQERRALVLADTLTPAGKYYFANKSDLAYDPAYAFEHNWKLVSPRLYHTIQDTNYFRVRLNWTDLNGELGLKYILERKIDGRDADFVAVEEYDSYAAGAGMSFMDSVYGKASYRLKAFGLDGTTFVYNNTLDVISDAAPVPPVNITGTIVSSSIAKLVWRTAPTARSYNLLRSDHAAGPWTIVSARDRDTTYTDNTLTPGTTYYFAVTTLNSAGESANSNVLSLVMPPLATPASVLNPRIAAGDGKAVLTWDFQYDAKYKIVRAASPAGPWDTVGTMDGLKYIDAGLTNANTYYYKAVAFNTAGTSPATDVMTARPVWGRHLHLGFDEGTGTKAYDDWGGYNANLYNSAAWAAGRDHAAGAVNLVKSSSSYVQLDTGVVSGLHNFTIATWFRMPTNQGNNTRLFDFGNNTGTFMILIPRVNANGVQNLRYKITCAAGNNDRYMPYELPLGSWNHVVISQQDNTFKLYVNGVLRYTDQNATVKPSDMGTTTNNWLGRSQYGNDAYTDHSYDDFSIYNYALSDGDVMSLYNGNLVILPITLSSFSGKTIAQGNLLSWQVHTTSASLKMELEKGSDGRSFSPIYNATATRAATQAPFSFIDAHATGISYYRLKLTDVDAKVTYSPVVLINGKVKRMELLGLYPTLVKTNAFLSINAEKAAPVKLVITDISGRNLQSASHSLTAGSNLLNVDASALANGNYTISVYADNQRVGSIRFVVSR